MTVIALLDGPLPDGHPSRRRSVAFCDLHPDVRHSPAAQHACQMAAAIRQSAPDALLESYVIFPGRLATSVSIVCEALREAARSDADIVHCSFGIARNAAELADVVASILASGKRIVASAPARGEAVYPALYDGVISVQGDARCGPGEWSWLNLPHARFGACAAAAKSTIHGASTAAAHFTGLLAGAMQSGREDEMQQAATYRGRERILAGGGFGHDEL